ncbi:MAG: hypothetical protein ACKV22_26360 [Bryobacteraceae bacterium]
MRRAGLSLGVIFVAVLLLQASEAPKPPQWIADEIEAIERLAEAEPVSASIDTRLRLADALKRNYPAEGARITRSALQTLPQVRAGRIRSSYGLRAVELLAIAGDLEGAELALPMFRQNSPEFSRALQQVTAHWLERGRQPAADFMSRSLDTGYFDPLAVHMVLRQSVRDDPGEARLLFAKTAALALQQPVERHLLSLFALVQEIGTIEPTAAVGFLVKLLDLVTSESFQLEPNTAADYRIGSRVVETKGTREGALFQIGAFLRAWSPQSYERYQRYFLLWDDPLKGITVDNVRRVTVPERFTMAPAAREPDVLPYASWGVPTLRAEELDERPLDVALEAARVETQPIARAMSLVNLLRANFQIRGADWKSVADEALFELEKAAPPARFGVLTTLFDLALQHRRQDSTAQRCGEALLALIGQQSRCDEYECEKEDNPGIAVGTAYQGMADRLSWHQRDAGDLGLKSVSLEVRDRLSRFNLAIHRPALSAR